MARPPRIEVPGGYFHVFSRGNERGAIFVGGDDYAAFGERLAVVAARMGWRVICFCLMGNHFHLLVQTTEPNLARGMHLLNSGYAQSFNRRHDRVGHLFQGRYKAVLVQGDEHLLTEIRYIVRNPLNMRQPVALELWPHSSHRAALGLVPPPSFLDTAALLALFGPTRPIARARYRDFVAGGDSPSAAHPLVAGDPEFSARHIAQVVPSPEFPRRYGLAPPPLAKLLAAGPDPAAITAANRRHGYSMRQIATHLHCGVATISRRIAAHEAAQPADVTQEKSEARGTWKT